MDRRENPSMRAKIPVVVVLFFVGLIIGLSWSTKSHPTGVVPTNIEWEVGFSPRRGSQDAVIRVINSATKELRMATYSFTNKEIVAALIAAKARGVDVKIVSDEKSNGGDGSAVRSTAAKGIPTRLNGNYAIHHHKFIVADGTTVQTGSFNYSRAAWVSNAENVIVLRGVPDIATTYITEWNRLWEESYDYVGQ